MILFQVSILFQGGPGSTSMYGLLKENGPFLVDAKKQPFMGPFLKKNAHSWHKIANVLYIDNPAGTGFSHFESEPSLDDLTSGPKAEEQISKELADFLLQFMKIYPYYVNGSDSSTKIYLFGESYGGTYVTKLGSYILTNPRYSVSDK